MENKEAKISSMKAEYEELLGLQRASEVNFERELKLVEDKYVEKESELLRVLEEQEALDVQETTTNKGGEELQRKQSIVK